MYEIKEMQPEDLDEVAELEKEIFSTPWSRKGFEDALKQEAVCYLVVRENGVLAGYCGLIRSFDEADITNVAVSPLFRNRGIAQAMLQRLMEQGEKKGIFNYTLEVRAGNAPALRVYEKLGFESVGIRPRFYEKPVEDAVIMWKYGEK